MKIFLLSIHFSPFFLEHAFNLCFVSHHHGEGKWRQMLCINSPPIKETLPKLSIDTMVFLYMDQALKANDHALLQFRIPSPSTSCLRACSFARLLKNFVWRILEFSTCCPPTRNSKIVITHLAFWNAMVVEILRILKVICDFSGNWNLEF